jgi:phenylalanyl-tRNA synthetase beta chain
MTGNLETDNWQRKTKAITYYDLAQQISNIFNKTGIRDSKQEEINDQLLEYGVKITVHNKELGKIGKIKSSLVKDFGVKQDLFYAELNTSLLFKSANPKLVIQEVPKFPEVKRDLSLVIDAPVKFEEIQNLIMNTEKRLIKNIVAFDVYEGDKIPEGKKAYALSFTLLDESKTLTDEEIEKTMARLISAFEEKLGAIIRK